MDIIYYFDIIPYEIKILIFLNFIQDFDLWNYEERIYGDILTDKYFWKLAFEQDYYTIYNKDLLYLLEGNSSLIKKYDQYSRRQKMFRWFAEYTNVKSVNISYSNILDNMPNFTAKIPISYITDPNLILKYIKHNNMYILQYLDALAEIHSH